jgi:hypothetical protein
MNKQFFLLSIAFFTILGTFAIELTPELFSNPRNIIEAIDRERLLISPIIQNEYNELTKLLYGKLMETPEGQAYKKARTDYKNSVNSEEELTASIAILSQTETFKKEYWPVRQQQLKQSLTKAALTKMASYVNAEVGESPRDSMHQAINSALFIDNHPTNEYENAFFEQLEEELYSFADHIDRYYASKIK